MAHLQMVYIVDFPIKNGDFPSINGQFSMAMLNNQMV